VLGLPEGKQDVVFLISYLFMAAGMVIFSRSRCTHNHDHEEVLHVLSTETETTRCHVGCVMRMQGPVCGVTVGVGREKVNV